MSWVTDTSLRPSGSRPLCIRFDLWAESKRSTDSDQRSTKDYQVVRLLDRLGQPPLRCVIAAPTHSVSLGFAGPSRCAMGHPHSVVRVFGHCGAEFSEVRHRDPTHPLRRMNGPPRPDLQSIRSPTHAGGAPGSPTSAWSSRSAEKR